MEDTNLLKLLMKIAAIAIIAFEFISIIVEIASSKYTYSFVYFFGDMQNLLFKLAVLAGIYAVVILLEARNGGPVKVNKLMAPPMGGGMPGGMGMPGAGMPNSSVPGGMGMPNDMSQMSMQSVDSWQCQRCGSINQGNAMNCVQCGSPKMY